MPPRWRPASTKCSPIGCGWTTTLLAADLHAIGAKGTPEELSLARTLFARVLDCPGGGLRIDTIHAFSQWLLAAFPEEAELVPGTRPMEDRDRDLLAHQVLADLLVDWEEQGDSAMLGALSELSVRMGPDGVRAWLMRCAEAREAWFGPGGWQEPLHERVRTLIGLPSDAGPHLLEALCADDAFDCAALRECLATLSGWDTATGREGAAAASRHGSRSIRRPGAEASTSFSGTLFNKNGFAAPDGSVNS